MASKQNKWGEKIIKKRSTWQWMFQITILSNYRYTPFVLWNETINSKIKEWCKDFPVLWLLSLSYHKNPPTNIFHNQKNQKNQTFSQSKNQKMVNEWVRRSSFGRPRTISLENEDKFDLQIVNKQNNVLLKYSLSLLYLSF